MVEYGKEHHITILVAGGVRYDNLPELHAFLKATAYQRLKVMPETMFQPSATHQPSQSLPAQHSKASSCI